jgi:hypothetical protein
LKLQTPRLKGSMGSDSGGGRTMALVMNTIDAGADVCRFVVFDTD